MFLLPTYLRLYPFHRTQPSLCNVWTYNESHGAECNESQCIQSQIINRISRDLQLIYLHRLELICIQCMPHWSMVTWNVLKYFWFFLYWKLHTLVKKAVIFLNKGDSTLSIRYNIPDQYVTRQFYLRNTFIFLNVQSSCHFRVTFFLSKTVSSNLHLATTWPQTTQDNQLFIHWVRREEKKTCKRKNMASFRINNLERLCSECKHSQQRTVLKVYPVWLVTRAYVVLCN